MNSVLFQLFAEQGAPQPINVYVFPSKTERSASGTCEFNTVEEATEALVMCNHTPVVSPIGKVGICCCFLADTDVWMRTV